MNLRMSIPSVAFQVRSVRQNHDRDDQVTVMGSWAEQVKIREIPEPFKNPREFLAFSALSTLIKQETIDWAPDLFVGCNLFGDKSISSNAILQSVGWAELPMNIVECLDLAQAFNYLSLVEQFGGTATLLLLSKPVPPSDLGLNSEPVSGHAAVAVGLSSDALKLGKSFRILGLAHTPEIGNWHEKISMVIEQLLRAASCKRQDLRWSITPSFSKDFEKSIMMQLPTIQLYKRESLNDTDFGCIDSIVSLRNIFAAQRLPPCGIGIVWYFTENRVLGGIILQSDDVGLWKRYISERPSYIK